MSSSQNASPAVEPLHHPNQTAQVHIPQAPLGNATNSIHKGYGGQKALLAKKMAKANNPSTVSPTDNMMTPCTAKISQAKKKHFSKAIKPLSFAPAEGDEDEDEDDTPTTPTTTSTQ
ncbi:hypothetical protein FRB99_007086 [Tulasnella sp. 403]|nr:hypothetical protein FRB99_007086 [Tulasnella sp. 403]